MNKLTKIVATIGPSSDSPEMIEKLINAGVNVFRFNFKHNTVEWHSERIKSVNEIAKKMGRNIGTLIDLQGPEIRIRLTGETIEMKEGEKLLFGDEIYEKKTKGLTISHPSIIPHLKNGQKIFADDGYFAFTLLKENDKTYLVADTTGVMKTNKTLNIPGADFPFPVLIERDFEGLKMAAKEEIDFVALSFVRTYDDLKVLREEMAKIKLTARLIAKIETQSSLDNLDAIIDEADGIMVARGDLGVEVSMEKVPYYQKLMIRKCLEYGKPVITATQMLESMIKNPRPTRAEVSDVANAVYDHTDAVMLSGESASGSYPLAAVEYMAKTVAYTEKYVQADLRTLYNYYSKDQEGLLADTAYNLYVKAQKSNLKIKGFVVLTETGRTVTLLSRYRPEMPIYAFCPSNAIADRLSLSFGVQPIVQKEVYQKEMEVTGNQVRSVIKYLLEQELAEAGDKFIVLHGDAWSVEGGSSTVKIVEIN